MLRVPNYIVIASITFFFFSLYRNLMDGRERAYPDENYLSGDGKSLVWMGHGYYAPHNRSWHKHHEIKATPGLNATGRIPDKIEFTNEDDWREWQKRRDTPGSGKYCASSGKKYQTFCQL